MNKINGKAITILPAAIALATVALCGCGDDERQPKEEVVPFSIGGAAYTVEGFEWGASVTSVTLEFADNVSDVSKETFELKVQASQRTASAAYVSDADGNPSQQNKYVTVELETKYKQSNPFSGKEWVKNLLLEVNVATDFKIGDGVCKKGDGIKQYKIPETGRRVPQLEGWQKSSHTYTEGEKVVTLGVASWTPDGAATDGGKNPLVIWLHGAGEGGTNLDSVIFGNEVTALTSKNKTNVQKYFTSDTCAGAYVLAVQTPTMWKDAGNGVNNTTLPGDGKQVSYYTEALIETIHTYADGNADIDKNRIYVGGCSNGGYMTMNLMFEDGDYYAAYYPCCEGYMNRRITDEMIDGIKNKKAWFVCSADDTTLDPEIYILPTYARLMAAGAPNMHFTLFDHVRGTDDPHPSMSAEGFYDGHSCWIELFNDNVKKQFDNASITGKEYLTPENCTAPGNLWQWLSQQSK